uniref:Uncharacterized protein n=1 Tax=viral metagenome TaxID=1070528 RepID=A0A6C0H643_9ZZZZ
MNSSKYFTKKSKHLSFTRSKSKSKSKSKSSKYNENLSKVYKNLTKSFGKFNLTKIKSNSFDKYIFPLNIQINKHNSIVPSLKVKVNNIDNPLYHFFKGQKQYANLNINSLKKDLIYCGNIYNNISNNPYFYDFIIVFKYNNNNLGAIFITPNNEYEICSKTLGGYKESIENSMRHFIKELSHKSSINLVEINNKPIVK